MNLVVTVAAELVAEGHTLTPIFVVNADSRLENPEVALQLDGDVNRLKSFCADHNIPLTFHQSTPALGSEWVVKILSGRNLPIFSNRKHRDCSIDLKIRPMERLKKRLLKEIEKAHGKPVTLIGTRFAESSGRKERMEARGEDAESIWSSDTSGDMLSPIASWTDQNVWDYISAVSLGQEKGFCDFNGLTRLYRDGSDMSQKSCDSSEIPDCRFGCSLCTVGVDRSMACLLKNNPERYGYMTGINKLQKFLLATQYDLDRRQWIGRTINDGFIAIGPDTYSPAMLEELFLMALTLDAEEADAAYELGIEPRFMLLHPRAIIAIDAIWSQQGIHRPFHGLSLFKKVYHEGFRLPVPEIEQGARVPIPEKRYLHVGEAWMEEGSPWAFCGMRDVSLEMVTDSDSFSGCGHTETLSNGRTVQVPEYGDDGLFEVDEESAMMVLGMELDYLLRQHENPHVSNVVGYNTYVSMGVLQLSSRRQASTSDYILRRTAFRESQDLIGSKFNLQHVIDRTISKKEMLAAVGGVEGTSEDLVPVPTTQLPAQMDLFAA